jgi:uncharacterized protein (TIGR03086 family)
MSETAERFRKVAGQFTERAKAVPDHAWDNRAPCEGWVARDVVRHMVEWMPVVFLTSVGIEPPQGASVDDDPLDAWEALNRALQGALDDPEISARRFDMRAGRYSVEQAIATFCIGDVLVHTWDLARSTGGNETLDADEVHTLLQGMEPIDELLRQSGHYGPRILLGDDANEQDKLLAFTGRRP